MNKCEEKERIFCDGDKKVKVRMPGVGDSTENKVTLHLSLSSQPPNVVPKTFQGCCSEINSTILIRSAQLSLPLTSQRN